MLCQLYFSKKTIFVYYFDISVFCIDRFVKTDKMGGVKELVIEFFNTPPTFGASSEHRRVMLQRILFALFSCLAVFF